MNNPLKSCPDCGRFGGVHRKDCPSIPFPSEVAETAAQRAASQQAEDEGNAAMAAVISRQNKRTETAKQKPL